MCFLENPHFSEHFDIKYPFWQNMELRLWVTDTLDILYGVASLCSSVKIMSALFCFHDNCGLCFVFVFLTLCGSIIIEIFESDLFFSRHLLTRVKHFIKELCGCIQLRRTYMLKSKLDVFITAKIQTTFKNYFQ